MKTRSNSAPRMQTVLTPRVKDGRVSDDSPQKHYYGKTAPRFNHSNHNYQFKYTISHSVQKTHPRSLNRPNLLQQSCSRWLIRRLMLMGWQLSLSEKPKRSALTSLQRATDLTNRRLFTAENWNTLLHKEWTTFRTDQNYLKINQSNSYVPPLSVPSISLTAVSKLPPLSQGRLSSMKNSKLPLDIYWIRTKPIWPRGEEHAIKKLDQKIRFSGSCVHRLIQPITINIGKKVLHMTKQCNHKIWKQQTVLDLERFVEIQPQTSFIMEGKAQELILPNGRKDLSSKVLFMALRPMQYWLIYS